jgi:hypothetical protein
MTFIINLLVNKSSFATFSQNVCRVEEDVSDLDNPVVQLHGGGSHLVMRALLKSTKEKVKTVFSF